MNMNLHTAKCQISMHFLCCHLRYVETTARLMTWTEIYPSYSPIGPHYREAKDLWSFIRVPLLIVLDEENDQGERMIYAAVFPTTSGG